MDRRNFIASAGLAIGGFFGIGKAFGAATTGFPSLDKSLGGLQRGEVHAWVGSRPKAFAGWYLTPNGSLVRYHSRAELRELDEKWAGWKTIFLLDIGHVAYQWHDKPQIPDGWESAGERQLGRCLLVLSPAGIRYWVMETNLFDTSSRIHREDFVKRDMQRFLESHADMDVVEIAAMTLFKRRGLMPGRDYEDTIQALKEDWRLLRDGKHEMQSPAYQKWLRQREVV